jgi:hypothetical protein
MPKQYVVKLTEQERAQLLALTRKGKAGARRITRALVLVRADAGAVHASGIRDRQLGSVDRSTEIPAGGDAGGVMELMRTEHQAGGRTRWADHLLLRSPDVYSF